MSPLQPIMYASLKQSVMALTASCLLIPLPPS